MIMMESARSTARSAWGWALIAAVCTMLLVSAAWLFTFVGTPSLFEADTGVSASEFAAAYPSVARELTGRGRTIALLVGALALLALTAAAVGWRTGAAATRPTLWAFAAALTTIGTVSAVGGRPDVGSFHIGLGALTAVGLLLAGRGTRPR